jgi:methenyltetrahydromethanopterin cyclohydrolase
MAMAFSVAILEILTAGGKGKSLFMISVNQRAAAIVRRMVEDSEALGIEVHRLNNGAVVVDCGIKAPGSFEAGRLFCCASMGGLGTVEFTNTIYDQGGDGTDSGLWFLGASIDVSIPSIACMGSQYAGWEIKLEHYSAIGSGPARALHANEEIFRKLDYKDDADTAVLMIESRKLPGEEVAAYVAGKCNVKPDQVILLIAPTASLVGSIQIASRVVETGMHKFVELGFDVRKVKAASGLCPLAPVAQNDLKGIGRTNDAILYGGQAFFTVQAADDELESLIEKMPSCSSAEYGSPFYDILMRANGDFYRIDRMLFSPAQVKINNLASGRTFSAGRIDAALLRASLLES